MTVDREKVYCVLVCGGRDYADRAKVYACLDAMLFLYGDLMVITGACRTGADKFAEDWAKHREQIYVGVPAQWQKYSKAAGMRRNRTMATVSAAQQVIAFAGKQGTLNMLSLATDKAVMGDIIVWLPDGEFWK